ncbi:hypothetical protein HG531_005791 [Fusarium graminearum]|nr:hypothetical protein HG531_005791 [Fusarium graminearum]
MLTLLIYLLQQRLSSQLTQIIRSQRRITRQQQTITVTFSRDCLINRRNPKLLKPLTYQPLHLAGNVSNVDISALIQRIRENVNAVSLVDEVGSLRLSDISGENTSGTMAKGDEKAVVGISPAEHIPNCLAERYTIEDTMASRDEYGDVGCILSKPLSPDFGKIKRAAKLLLVLVVNRLDSLVLLGKSPHLKLDGIARKCSYINVETCGIEVIHWQKHLNRVVARGKELSICHFQVALLGADHEDLPFAAGVLVWIVGAVKVCL